MRGPGRSIRRPAASVVVLALTVGGLAALPPADGADAPTRPFVDDGVVRRALASDVPARPTMSDEIDHFRGRAAAKPNETFALERLFTAHMLAFRAYGDHKHLERASEVVDRLGGHSSSPGTSTGRAPEAPAASSFEASASSLPDASAEASRSVRSLRSVASLSLAEHDFGSALSTARTLASVSNGETSTYRLFDALWAVGAREEAEDLLEGTVDTLSTAYLSRRARVIDARGFVEPARDLFHRVVDNVRAYAEPVAVHAWALAELGHFELHSGDPEAAVRRYQEALDVLPGSPAALEGLASVAYGVDRDLDRARDLYRKALVNGAHLDVMPVLADIEEALGRRTEALRIRRDFVTRATKDDRSEAMHRRPLIFVLAEAPSTRAEAVRLAHKDLAVRQDPGAFHALAWTLHRAGEVEMAWTLAERALAGGGAPPPILFRSGLMAEAAGERARARELLEQALDGKSELAPHEAEAARERLDRRS